MDDGPFLTRVERVVAFGVGALIVVTLAIIILYHAVALRILPGEAGVRFSLLFGGTVLDRTIPPGFALKLPWDRVYVYEMRTQRTAFVLNALTRDDMEIEISASTLFRPKPDQVPYLQEAIGPQYVERVVAPVSVAAVREAVGSLNAFSLYSENATDFKALIDEHLTDHPISQYVDFVDVVITRVVLPEKLISAIEDKLSQEQLLQSFDYRLQTQIQEAERRRIEAIGISVFYDIVRQALTPDLLTWRGIEATVQLARSSNSKIVVVGGGRDQLPIILGGELTRGTGGEAGADGDSSGDGLADPFDTDRRSFEVDPGAFEQLPDFRSLPDLFDDSALLPRAERAPSNSQGSEQTAEGARTEQSPEAAVRQ